jgi:hypothetical protein
MCGAVVDYEDELGIFTEREARKQIIDRQKYIIRHGIALEVPPEGSRKNKVPLPLGGGSSFETTKMLIMIGVDNGMEVARIAELLDLEPDYIEMIAKNGGAK